jgi:hypothetical protein
MAAIARDHGRDRAAEARPVILTVAAVLGMIPLAGSIFCGPVAITIMGGLRTRGDAIHIGWRSLTASGAHPNRRVVSVRVTALSPPSVDTSGVQR